MKISMIVAMAQNRVIGANNSLPWHIPDDLKRFRALTTGHALIMGRKTFESLPRVLPGRDHYVITRTRDYKEKNEMAKSSDRVFVAATPQETLSLLRNRPDGENESAEEVFVIGGGEIYRQMLPFANRLYITFVKKDVDGDTCFPEIDPVCWRETERQVMDEYDFIVYDRMQFFH